MGKGGIMDEISCEKERIETNRSSIRLPAQTSQLQLAQHVIHVDVFGFTETKAILTK